MALDGPKARFHPRSPVQDGRSPAPFFAAAIVAAVLVYMAQQLWTADSPMPNRASSARQDSASGRLAAGSDIRTVFSADDYPASAQAKGEEGTVRTRLTVDREGRVSGCAIIASSGSASLDSATCNILTRRARFTPARDASGKPVASTVNPPPIAWRLEG